MRSAWAAAGLAAILGCGSGGAGHGAGHGGAASASASSSTATGTGGAGGAGPTCPQVPCTGPGEDCISGACVADCRPSGANPCGTGKVCDVSDANPGKCVDPSSACVTTSAPEMCGGKVCGPGAACDGH